MENVTLTIIDLSHLCPVVIWSQVIERSISRSIDLITASIMTH